MIYITYKEIIVKAAHTDAKKAFRDSYNKDRNLYNALGCIRRAVSRHQLTDKEIDEETDYLTKYLLEDLDLVLTR